MTELAEDVLSGNRRGLARALTIVENERDEAELLLDHLYPHAGESCIIGVTGAPGTGKSTLVTALAKAYREKGQTVGILAVDPSSPVSGGALLGDRIRMRALSGDTGVFIRSMAARGQTGGLGQATLDAVTVMDAAGFDIIIVETVGAGQSEVDIAGAAQTTLVIEAPGLGDDIQAIKAGILEIADVLVVNKADQPEATNTVRALQMMLTLGGGFQGHHGPSTEAISKPKEEAWTPPIVRTIATDGTGLEILMDTIAAHQDHLKVSPTSRSKLEALLLKQLQRALLQEFRESISDTIWSETIDQLESKQLSPRKAVRKLLSTRADHHRTESTEAC